MIDPSIALSFKNPQFADPLEQAGKAMNLLAMRQQAQMAPLHQAAAVQQLQAGQMENDQRQMDLQDQQRMRQVWVASGGDPDKMLPMAVRAGIGPKPLMALRESLMKMATDKANLDEKTLANHAAKNDALNALLQPVVTETDPAKQQALWDQQMGEGLRSGVLSPEEVQQHPYPGSPDAVKAYAAGLTTDKWATAQAAAMRAKAAADQAQTSRDRFNAELPGIQSGNLTKGLQTAGQTIEAVNSQPEYDAWRQANPEAAKRLPPMFSPALKTVAQRLGLTADQQVTTDQAAANLALQRQKEGREASQGAQHIGIERSRLAVEQTNAGVDANGQPLKYTDEQGNPVNISPIAKQIAEYKLPAPAARSYASNKGLMNQVLAANPNFDIGQYEQRYQTLKDLRPGGKLGSQALALNTLIRHSDDLIDAVGALGNGSFTPANAGYQKLRQIFGDSAPTNFDQLKQFVAGETVKLVRNGGGDQEDMKAASANINRAGSPQQLLDALKVNFGVAGGKMQALNQAVRASTGQKDYTALDQGATDILKRRGYDTETMKPAAAGGKKPLSEIFK